MNNDFKKSWWREIIDLLDFFLNPTAQREKRLIAALSVAERERDEALRRIEVLEIMDMTATAEQWEGAFKIEKERVRVLERQGNSLARAWDRYWTKLGDPFQVRAVVQVAGDSVEDEARAWRALAASSAPAGTGDKTIKPPADTTPFESPRMQQIGEKEK